MRALLRHSAALPWALVLAFAGWQPVAAQDDSSGPQVLRDTETEALFRDMSVPLIQAGGLDPNSVKVVLLNDPEINAFAAQGQTVYLQSGLIQAADNVNEVQGVVAHELGHVIAGDSIRSGQGEKQAMGITILSLLLGAVAVAAGAGDAGMGIMMAGQRAALGGIGPPMSLRTCSCCMTRSPPIFGWPRRKRLSPRCGTCSPRPARPNSSASCRKAIRVSIICRTLSLPKTPERSSNNSLLSFNGLIIRLKSCVRRIKIKGNANEVKNAVAPAIRNGSF